MKIGKVIPLYKAGDRIFFSNYRPISLYQARNNTLSVSIQHIFTRYEGKLLNTRQQIDFLDKFARTNVRAMSMRIVGVKLWNDLDHCLKNSKTRCIFSKSYKENVLRSY